MRFQSLWDKHRGTDLLQDLEEACDIGRDARGSDLEDRVPKAVEPFEISTSSIQPLSALSSQTSLPPLNPTRFEFEIPQPLSPFLPPIHVDSRREAYLSYSVLLPELRIESSVSVLEEEVYRGE